MADEGLTIRLDPRTKFALEVLARRRGQTTKTAVARAVLEHASRTSGSEVPWADVWDVSEGMRTLKVAVAFMGEPTDGEARLSAFVEAHASFLMRDGDLDRARVEVLWPRIGEFLAAWCPDGRAGRVDVTASIREALETAGLMPAEVAK